MNNVFDIKRFGQYFLYDLRNAKNNFGLSLLILGTLPVTLFIVYELVSLIFGTGINELEMSVKWVQFTLAGTIAMLAAGTKIYGTLTEKRAGSNFLMLPASTFEKWLSMCLIVCIALPAVLFVLQFASDALMSFLFPNSYGERLYALAPLQEIEAAMDEVGVHVNLPAIIFLNWCETVLIFTLGAVCFKKSKIAKTFLCLIALSFLFSTIGMVILGQSGGNFYFNWFDHFNDPATAVSSLNWVLSVSFAVVICGLLGGLYYRLRTLKH